MTRRFAWGFLFSCPSFVWGGSAVQADLVMPSLQDQDSPRGSSGPSATLLLKSVSRGVMRQFLNLDLLLICLALLSWASHFSMDQSISK